MEFFVSRCFGPGRFVSVDVCFRTFCLGVNFSTIAVVCSVGCGRRVEVGFVGRRLLGRYLWDLVSPDWICLELLSLKRPRLGHVMLDFHIFFNSAVQF
jgi:hypothetical protein